MKTLEWHGCYSKSWRGQLVNDSFTHPAKFAPGLIERILIHGIQQSYWKHRDCIGDPFGGVACGGIIAQRHNLRWVGVELEARFVEIGQQNIQLHEKTGIAFGLPVPRLIQGDSRSFAEIVDAVVTSPPWTMAKGGGGGFNRDGYAGSKQLSSHVGAHYQGEHGDRTPGNIETLPAGVLEGIVSSPPYADAISAGAGGKDTQHPDGRQRAKQVAGANLYGQLPEQIGNLPAGQVDGILTSPPHGDTRIATVTTPNQDLQLRRGKWREDAYGTEEGQIGNLTNGKIDAVVTSPPWESNTQGSVGSHKFKNPEDFQRAGRGNGASDEARRRQLERDKDKTYGDSAGQIGRECGETYWMAMDKVYRACFAALRPGGVMCVVVKDYVKRKQRVTLCDDTLKLLLHVGFEGLERVQAMLVTEKSRHASLFGGDDIVEVAEHKSFFRRVQENNGSPRIDFEEVLIVRRPTL